MAHDSVSVIVVLYHSSHLVADIINNILEYIDNVNDIILVDNSRDDLSGFEKGCVRVVYPEKNIGYGAAINLGVNIAKNRNIVAMNPDLTIEKFDFDFMHPPSPYFLISGITNNVKSLDPFPSLYFDFCRVGLINLAKIFQPIRYLFKNIDITANESFVPVDWTPGLLIVSNKKTFENIGGFDENFFLFYEETDLCNRAHQQQFYVGITRDIRLQSSAGQSSSIDVSEIKITSEVDSLKRYHGKYSPRIPAILVFKALKIWSLAIASLCFLTSIVVNNEKIQQKKLQYSIYAKKF